jgi:hypothetical protein
MATKRQFIEYYDQTGRRAGLTLTFTEWSTCAAPDTPVTPKPTPHEITAHPALYYFDYDVAEDYIWTVRASTLDAVYQYKSGRVGPGDGNTAVLVVQTYTYPVTIHVQDDLGASANDVECVIRDAAESGNPIQLGRTNAAGNYSSTLNAGDFALRCANSALLFTNPKLFTVAGAMTVTHTGIRFTPSAPSASEQALWGYALHGDNTGANLARILARPVDENQIVGGAMITVKPIEAAANSSGYWVFGSPAHGLIKGAKYDVFESWGGTQFFLGRIVVTTDASKNLATYTFE